MKRILVIDPSQEVQTAIKQAMEARYELTFASSLAEVQTPDLYDLVLMESQLQGEDGYAICAKLKEKEDTGSIPVIFVSNQSLVADKIQAFNAGAEDYIVKPFDPLELVARIELRLKKRETTAELEPTIQNGDLNLSVPFQKATLQEGDTERDLRLTPTEFRLLYFFIKNQGQVLSRNQLLSTIWSDEVHVLSRTIDKHISTLKKKLGPRANYIQSVHSKGYRYSIVADSPLPEEPVQELT